MSKASRAENESEAVNVNTNDTVLSGLQRGMLEHFALVTSKSQTLETGPIFTMDLANRFSCSIASVKSAIHNLKIKKSIEVVSSKKGRGGWSSFKVIVHPEEYKTSNPATLKSSSPEKDDVWIYFIKQNTVNGHIKIGLSHGSPKNRMAQLQTGSPVELNLLHFFKAERKVESELHARFMHIHERGEWFRETEELLDFISVLKQNGKIPMIQKEFDHILSELMKSALTESQKKSILLQLDSAV